MTKNILLLTLFVFITSTSLWAQDKGPRSGYKFQTVADLKTTPVKDQQSVGTCWDYATISFLESELLRMGKPEYNLAEIFVAKNAYYEKGVRYIQFHGNNNFSEGGQAHDVIAMIKKYGMPQDWNNDGKFGPERCIEAHIWSDDPIQKYRNFQK